MRSFLYAVAFFFFLRPTWAVVHEQLPGVPSGWTKVQDAAEHEQLSLSISLQYQNIEQLESKLMSVSTPGSPQYRKYLDRDQLNAMFPIADANAIIAWLQSEGVQTIHNTGDAVNFATTVGTANKLLNTQFAHYATADGSGTKKMRTTQYSIPDHLTKHVDLVWPTTFFGNPKKRAAITGRNVGAHVATKHGMLSYAKRQVSADCSQGITPSCLKQMYNIGNYTANARSGSRIGFGSFLNQSAIYSDLAAYEKKFSIPAQSFSVELINGGINNQEASTDDTEEANLDAQNIVGVGHPLPVTEFITGGLA